MDMKRRKTEIKDLTDETLMEILVRVPVKSAHQCKLVSKHWLGLISSGYFVRSYRRRHQDHHHLHLTSYSTCNVFSMVNSPSNSLTLTFEVQVLPKNHPLISLYFLNQQWPMKKLRCVSNDLLLIESNSGECTSDVPSARTLNLSVSNPLTKQSYRLPEPPASFLDSPFTEFLGIICSIDDPTLYKVVIIKDTPRRIVRRGSIVRSSEILNFYVFSSDTSSWCNFHVPAPTFVLDNPKQRDFIDLPQEAKLVKMYGKKVDQRSLCIANVEQHLRLYHWSYVTAFTKTLTVWDMKDYRRGHGGTWNIKNFVDLTSTNWLCADAWMSIKGFDPYDGDVLYVFSQENHLLAVNLRSKTVQLVSEFKSTLRSLLLRFKLFPYCPPQWPTTITNSIAATPTPTTALL
uniref:F-box domain-containing protein n=1 Tax=Chenopodium quinoa TaxID=63459 RepID=A0A803LYX9_CHEQI